MKNLLEVENLNISFNKINVLNNINLQIEPGEVVSIIGRSGSGKTVLLKTIAGLFNPNSGLIKFQFKEQHNLLGYALQKSALFPWLTVLENLNLCTKNLIEKNQVNVLLKQFDLEKFKNEYPENISGGMCQKVNLIRALVQDSELLLMDEPFSAIDSLQRTELQQFTYENFLGQNKSILMTTHDINEAIFLSDRIIVLSSKSKSFSKEIKINLKKPKILVEILSHPEYFSLYKLVQQSLLQAEALHE